MGECKVKRWQIIVAGMWGITSLMSGVAFAERNETIQPEPLQVVQQPLVASIDSDISSFEGSRNPFVDSMQIEVEARNPETIQRGGAVFTPARTNKDVPQMRLRGHLEIEGKSVALLEIGDKQVVHIVREGDTVGLQEFGSDMVLRISKIDRLQVVVESGALGQQIIVR